MVKDIVIENSDPGLNRTRKIYAALDSVCYEFDLSKPKGAIVTTINGLQAQFMEELHDGDILDIYWKPI